jgi:hypothetical protein
MANLTRIKNNQITDGSILANTKIAAGSIVGSLFSSNITITSDFTVTGNLIVQGAQTFATIASTNTFINDPLIVLNNAFQGTNSNDLGFVFNRGSLTNQAFYWDESSDTFKLIATEETGSTYGSIASEVSYSNLQLGNITVQYTASALDISTETLTATGFINTSANVSAAIVNTGALNATGTTTVVDVNSTGFINTTANVSAAVVNAATVNADALNTTGFINTSANVSAAVVNAGALNASGTTTVVDVNSTGFINTTANVSAAVVNAGALNATGTTTVVDVNSTGFINTTGNVSAAVVNAGAVNSTGFINTTANVSAAVVNAGALNATGTTTVVDVNSTGFINTTGNVSAATVNTGALNATGTTTVVDVNSTGFINTTGNVSAAVVNAGALNATGTTTVVDVNSTGFINTTGNVSAATVTAGQINTTGNVLATAGIFNDLTVNGELTATGDVDGGLASFAAINDTPIGNATPNTGKFTTLTSTDLTTGRVVFTSTDGQLVDNAGLTFSANTVTVGGSATITIDGDTATIATTDEDQDLILAPNGDGAVDFSAANASNLADPVDQQDAVTLAYLESFASGSITGISEDDSDVTVTDGGGAGGTITANVDGTLATLINSSKADFFEGQLIITPDDGTSTPSVLTVSNATAATSTTTGAVQVTGGVGVQGNVVVGGQVISTSLDQSTNSTSGAIVTAGGVGIAKNLNVGGDAVITGNLTVQGTTTAVQSQTLDVTDLNITIAKGSADSATANGAGLTVDGADATLLYTHATTSWNFNKLVIATGLNSTGNVSGAVVDAGALNVTGTTTVVDVNSTGFINTTGNVSAAVVNAGALNATGTTTVVNVNSTGFINTTGNVSAAVVNTGALNASGTTTVVDVNSTGFINTTANVSAAVVNTGALNASGTTTVVDVNSTGTINTTGNVLAAAATFSSATVNGDVTIYEGNLIAGGTNGTNGQVLVSTGTGLVWQTLTASADKIFAGGSNVTVTADYVNVSVQGTQVASFDPTGLNGTAIGATTASTGEFTTLEATSTTTLVDVNSTGFINTTANVSAAIVNTGALNATGTTTVVDVNSTGFINTTANVSAAIVNTGALNATGTTTVVDVNSTGFINTTGNVSAAVVNAGALNATGTTTVVDVNSTGFINTTGNVSAATVNTDALNASGAVTLDNYTGYVYANAGSEITASTTIPNTDITGLGTISTQDADSVSITGGSVDGTTIGATTASTGKFTDLDATGTVYANATTDTSSLTTGAVIVAGGVAVGKTLYVGEGAVINSTQTNENFQVYGNVATTLIYADSVNNSVTLGGSNVTAIVGATVVVNSNDSMVLPRGATATRPGNNGATDVPGMIRFNTSLNDLEYYNGTTWTTPGQTVSIIRNENFNGDGTTTVFTLEDIATTNSALVSINGVVQSPTLAYAVSGTTLTFTEAPADGDLIEVRIITISTTFDALASSNGFASIDLTNDNFANITAGLASATVRLSADAGGNLTIANGTKLTYEQTAVSVTTSPTTVDAFDKTAFRAAKYIVTFTNGTTSYETAEILVIHDGTTATRTLYGSISTSGSDLGTYTVTISGDEVLLQCAAVSGTGTVKAMATYIRA